MSFFCNENLFPEGVRKLKNSFKKAYEKKILGDGSIEISFESTRFSQSNSLALFFPFAIASCTGAVGVMSATSKSSITNTVLSFALLAAVVFLLMKVFFKKKTTLIVKPKVGLTISGKTLPFSDVQSIVVADQGSGTYVEARSFGTSIRITGIIERELADAVVGELWAAR